MQSIHPARHLKQFLGLQVSFSGERNFLTATIQLYVNHWQYIRISTDRAAFIWKYIAYSAYSNQVININFSISCSE